jgi:hypothetical protein
MMNFQNNIRPLVTAGTGSRMLLVTGSAQAGSVLISSESPFYQLIEFTKDCPGTVTLPSLKDMESSPD